MMGTIVRMGIAFLVVSAIYEAGRRAGEEGR